MTYRTQHPDRAREQDRLYREANRDVLRAKSRMYAASHREQKRVRDASRGPRHIAWAPIVYVWMAPDGKADYVGRGTTQRARSHQASAPWWTPQHTLLTMTCDSEWQAMEMEGRWGAHYMPRFNKEGYRHAA